MAEVKGRRLHVLFYTDSDRWGGAEQVLATLISRLGDDIGITVMGTDEAVCRRVAAGNSDPTVLVRKPVRRGDVIAMARLALAMRAVRADVIHVNLTWPFDALEAQLVSAVAVPSAVVLHEHLPLPARRGWHRVMKRFISRRADLHVTVSRRGASDLAAGTGISVDDIAVIPNGIEDFHGPYKTRSDCRPTILGMGRFTEQKGFDVLLEAVQSLDGARLVLVGCETQDRLALLDTIGARGMLDRVTLIPWTLEPRGWFSVADVFAVSSRFESGQLVLLEAMSSGLAAVSTDVGSAREVMSGILSDYIVPTEDPHALAFAIKSLLSDPVRRKAVAEEGVRRVQDEYTSRLMASRFHRRYFELCASRTANRTMGLGLMGVMAHLGRKSS